MDQYERKLRLFESRDVSVRVEWINTPSVQAGLNVSGLVSKQSTLDWLARIAGREDRFDYVLEGSNSPLGMSGLTNIDYGSRSAELYAFVDPARTRQGLGYDLVRHTCHTGFVDLGLNRIYLWLFGANEAASLLYQKIGFSLEGVLRHHALHNGELVDRHVMGILQSEFMDDPLLPAVSY